MDKPQNPLRTRFIGKIEGAMKDAKSAGVIENPGLVGSAREILLSRLLQPVLPPQVRIGTGTLTDRFGKLTDQVDVIVYSPEILPPSLYDERSGVFPIESALYAIEVKSTLTSRTLAQAVGNARSIKTLSLLQTEHWFADERIVKPAAWPITALFAFSSDLTGDGKTELDRYRETDDKADIEPAIGVICVQGKGYWYFLPGSKTGWKFTSPTMSYHEILGFLSGMTNTIPQLLSMKGRPRFGYYLVDNQSVDA